MHSNLARSVTTFAILICLPIQGMAAVVMPACQTHGQKLEMHTIINESDANSDFVHHQVQLSSNCDQHHTDGHQTKSSPCDKCFFCYLSTTQAVIPLIISIDVISAVIIAAAPSAVVPDAISVSLYHPPRSTPAKY